MAKKNIDYYARLNKPVAYVAPLREADAPAKSYLVGVTDYLPDDVAMEWMQRSAAPDAPWRPTEVLRVELGDRVLDVLPANMYLRELIADFDYSTPLFGPRMQMEFVQHHRHTGYMAALNTPMMAWYHDGPPPENGFPDGLGAIWRNGRGTCVVDLDLHLKNFQLMVVQAAVSDFMMASDNLAGSNAALAEHAQEWSSADGKFRSPQETTSRYLAQRDAMREQVRQTYFRNPMAALLGSRIVRAALQRRARAAPEPRSVEEVIDQATQSALVQELPRVVIGQFVKHFTAESPPLTPAGLDEYGLRIRRQTIHAVTWALRKSIVDDIVDDPGWLAAYHRDYERERRWRSAHRTLVRLRPRAAESIDHVASESPDDQADRRIEESERKRLVRLVLERLTGQQRELAVAIMNEGLSPTKWAARAGKKENYGHVVLSKMRRKLRGLIE
ncbi:MAG TPA: hypothetical protein VFA43_23375 [Gemmatimonadaceae bacterium]|nr:hypothetical protein [Gemmatimonadaceae bacterium]